MSGGERINIARDTTSNNGRRHHQNKTVFTILPVHTHATRSSSGASAASCRALRSLWPRRTLLTHRNHAGLQGLYHYMLHLLNRGHAERRYFNCERMRLRLYQYGRLG